MTLHTVKLPPSIPLVRVIQYSLWESANMFFDGVHPLLVHSTYRDKDYWSFHIENYEEKPMCITRLNGIVRDKFVLYAAPAPK